VFGAGAFAAGVDVESDAGLVAGLGSALAGDILAPEVVLPEVIAAEPAVAEFVALDRNAFGLIVLEIVLPEVVVLDVIALSGLRRWSLLGPRPSLIKARESGVVLFCHP